MEATAPTTRICHPAKAGARPLAATDLWALPRLGNPVVSPDGKWLALPISTPDIEADRLASRIHLLASDGSSDRPLTSPDRHASQPSFSPDGTRIAFCARPLDDSSAPTQIYVMPLDGGEAERVTDLPLGAFDPQWTPDGTALIFGVSLLEGHTSLEATVSEHERRKDKPKRVHITEARMFRFWDRWLTNGKIPHFFRLDLASKELTDLTPDSTLWLSWMDPTGEFDIAPDGKAIVFTGLHVGGPQKRLRADIFSVATDGTGDVTCLTTDNPAGSSRARYSPDGTWILYGRTDDPDFYADRARLMRIDRATGKHSQLLEDWDRAPMAMVFDCDGNVVFHAEDDGASRVFRLVPGDAAPTQLGVSHGNCGAPQPSRDGSLYYVWQSLSSPAEIWRADADGGNARALTSYGASVMNDVALGEVRDMRFTGADGDEVQMFVILPPNHDASKPAPLVHMIHGGPHGTFGDVWHARWNAHQFAAPGYVVALVNFHGSTSWGQRFAQCIQGAWGDFPSTDIHAATDVLVEDGLVDPDRMAISGGSYGGYLVSWLASTSDRFACAVNHAGVYDLTLQYASDVTWGRPRNMGAQIWEDPAKVDKWNPARQAAGLNTPMLVLHGERDFRVPINHALVCYGILQAREIPSRLVYFEDENHWILKPQNSLVWFDEVLSWFDRYLNTDKEKPRA